MRNTKLSIWKDDKSKICLECNCFWFRSLSLVGLHSQTLNSKSKNSKRLAPSLHLVKNSLFKLRQDKFYLVICLIKCEHSCFRKKAFIVINVILAHGADITRASHITGTVRYSKHQTTYAPKTTYHNTFDSRTYLNWNKGQKSCCWRPDSGDKNKELFIK